MPAGFEAGSHEEEAPSMWLERLRFHPYNSSLLAVVK